MRGGGSDSRQTSSRTSVSLNTRISLYERWRAWLEADFVPDISVTKHTDLVVCEVEGLARGRLRPWHQCHYTHGSRCVRGGGPGSGQTSSRTSVSLHTRISLCARWRAWLGPDFVPDISVTKRTDLVVCEVEGLARGRLRPWHQCHKTHGSRCTGRGPFLAAFPVQGSREGKMTGRHRRAKKLTNRDETLKETPNLLLLYYQFVHPVQSRDKQGNNRWQTRAEVITHFLIVTHVWCHSVLWWHI